MRRRPDLGQAQTRLAAVLTLLVAVLLPPSSARAQWSNNPIFNTPVCTAPGGQLNSVAASDGAGGAIIAWVDNRVGGFDIYAQRVNAAGVAQWVPNGVPICIAGFAQGNPAIISDGLGGAIITWQDFRNGLNNDIYAQRVNAAGAVLWAPNGALVCGFALNQIWPMLVSDGANGAIITWEDDRAGGATPYEIYAQRISAAGVLMWPPFAGGFPICSDGVGPGTGDQLMPMLVEDGVGGAIITWYDGRVGGLAASDIYAQRVTAAGAVLWPLNGIAVCAAPLEQTQPTIATDGAGGAIITWYDLRLGGANYDIYAQRVSPLGLLMWPPFGGGVPVCVDPTLAPQEYPKIVSDGAGGAIVTWHDLRSLVDNDIYAQRVSALGVPLWIPNGVPVSVGPGNQELPKIVSDGAGGAIIAWNDIPAPLIGDIGAQRVNAAGVNQWIPISGIPISIAPGTQDWPFQFIPMVADGNGGAIITWTDARLGPTDIYAQNVNSDGTLGPRPLAFWRFEEGAGTTISDASGNGHTGSFVNAPTFTTDIPCGSVGGRANAFSLNFSPTPPFSAVEVPDSPTLRPTAGITVEAWVRPQGPGAVISKQFYYTGPPIRDVSSFELRMWGPPNGGVRFALCNASGVQTGVTGLSGPFPPINTWSHIAGTWDSTSGTMRVYVDFVEVASAPFAGPIAYDASPVTIGAEHNGAGGAVRTSYYFGDIDELRVFDRALTPAEMLRSTCPLAPIVMVNTPVANDTLLAGSNEDIRWVALDDGGVASLTLEFTSDGTATYSTLATGEPNDSLYSWLVPATYSDQCQIRVTAYDGGGNAGVASSLGYFHIVPVPTGVDPRGAPARLALSLYPNPFNPALTVSYAVPRRGRAEVAVFDVQGRRVATLVNGVIPAGERVVTWDGWDTRGAPAASGVYFVRLQSGGKTQVRKTVLLK